MKIEIYSLQSNNDDLQALNDSFKSVMQRLADNDCYVIYKTEMDASGAKIKKALATSLSDSDKPDMILVANALTTKDSTSFRELFADIVTEAESKIQDKQKKSKTKKKIKIFTLGDMGQGYKGYCFNYLGTKVAVLPSVSLTERTIEDLVTDGVRLANEVFENTALQYPDGIVTVEKEKKGFIKSIFPTKGDSGKEKARKTATLVAAAVFLVAGGFLINSLVIQPAENYRIQSEIQDIFHNTNNDNKTSVDNGSSLTKNWKELKKINEDIVGWIKLDGTLIDYPVLENKTDTSTYQFYLNHNYKKDWSSYGSIFVDYRAKQSVKSKNLVLHGHHMNDGSMFGNLLDYGGTWKEGFKGDLNFYKTHPTFTFDTPKENATWKIISVFKTNTLDEHGEFFNYMQSNFNSSAEFMNFVYNVRVRSLFNCPVNVNENDQIITLSTCSYEFSEFRTVVVARKVRENENFSVDVSKASLNKNAVWPQVYYNNQGGTRPKVTTFQTELKDGSISWYDGKGKLEGSEELTGSKKTTQPNKNGNAVIYTVEFINYDGTVLKRQEVVEGESATPPTETPIKPNDEYYSYTFTGWDMDYSKIISNMRVAATFKEHRLSN